MNKIKWHDEKGGKLTLKCKPQDHYTGTYTTEGWCEGYCYGWYAIGIEYWIYYRIESIANRICFTLMKILLCTE